MNQTFQFETPENIHVEYRVAGLGTRFVAWFVDQLIVWAAMFVFTILLFLVGGSIDGVISGLRVDGASEREAQLYLLGLIALAWGVGSFLYFGLSEYFLRGQTVGKRKCGIRVVKQDGFRLDPAGVLVRNAFRVLDHLPPLWLVPLLSRHGQRTGDMVAGTLVVADDNATLTEVRKEMSSRSAHEARFRFDHRQLQQLTERDFSAIEQILQRESALDEEKRQQLLSSVSDRLAARLGVEAPIASECRSFLEDLLASELRRQERMLG
ncbi:MAG: RDD family protein [Planctomycetales bacterium]|nr:RDD family protein [Planctomycetales bacterium]